MNFDRFPSPVQNRDVLSASYAGETNFQPEQPKREGLTKKIQNVAGKYSRHRKLSAPALTNLTSESQVRRKEYFCLKTNLFFLF